MPPLSRQSVSLEQRERKQALREVRKSARRVAAAANRIERSCTISLDNKYLIDPSRMGQIAYMYDGGGWFGRTFNPPKSEPLTTAIKSMEKIIIDAITVYEA